MKRLVTAAITAALLISSKPSTNCSDVYLGKISEDNHVKHMESVNFDWDRRKGWGIFAHEPILNLNEQQLVMSSQVVSESSMIVLDEHFLG